MERIEIKAGQFWKYRNNGFYRVGCIYETPNGNLFFAPLGIYNLEPIDQIKEDDGWELAHDPQ